MVFYYKKCAVSPDGLKVLEEAARRRRLEYASHEENIQDEFAPAVQRV
ncbi:Uncharacterised protein [Bacillus freudenreichii]|nr:Uncharacterised protein [Bacillus freudenreichii]